MLADRDRKYIQQALEKYEKGTSTEAESRFIETYLNYLDESNRRIDPFEGLEAGAKFELEKNIESRLLQTIHKRQDAAPVVKMDRRFVFTRQVAAAILFIVIGAVAYWFLSKPVPNQKEMAMQERQDVAPGKDRAILKLASGREIVLDSAHTEVVRVGNLKVSNDRGTLNYRGKSLLVENHTLSTPRGGQYKIQLPDGTHVWLNAGSSITYPTTFTGRERHVDVTGEVYMEVAKDRSRPFTVQTGRMRVAVLGTHFNINAYSDESGIKTTLFEGAVKVADGSETQILAPGEQTLVSANGIQLTKDVSMAEVIAWKEGMFRFENADIETIMRQLSRWYDIEVVYQGRKVKEYFNAAVPRNVPVSKVLTLLELTGMVHFAIDGRKIVVTP